MRNAFTGKEIKALNKQKNLDSVVFRIDGRYQTLEFIYRDFNRESQIKSSIEIDTEINMSKKCFVYMFAGQPDTTWQFFVEALKSTDKVRFCTRDNGSNFLKEKGLGAIELRGNVKRYKSDGSTLAKIMETTLMREHCRLGNN